MFRHPFKKNEETPLDGLINDILIRMSQLSPDADEYEDLITQLERLHDLKTKQRPAAVSGDTKAIVIGNLVGILLIVAYEQKHAMTSKSFTQIVRPKTPTIQ